ncbi:MAG TPA: phospholipase D-like domain-containing protein, partial [Bryobacteraceae bacterium]
MLHIDRDLMHFASALKELEAVEREVKQSQAEPSRSLGIPDGRGPLVVHPASADSWSFLSTDQQLEIRQAGLAYLDVHDHYPLLLSAVKHARFRLMIVCPFLHERVVTEELLQDLEKLLRNASKVYIGYGMPDSDSQKPSKSHQQILERLEKVARRFSNLVLRKVDSHAKVLLQDELFVVVGSFNWLSFRGDPDRAFRDEQSALV